MGTSFGALCSDFYINQKLAVRMDLPHNRETLLELFERIRKDRPEMSRLRRYEGELALESAPEDGSYEWAALRRMSVRSGVVNPSSMPEAYRLHRLLLEIAPFYLSLSPVEIDYLEILYGFDFEARGNHDEIVFEALYADSPLGRLVEGPQAQAVDVQPTFSFALDEKRTTRITVEVKTRHGSDSDPAKFDGEPISVFLVLRRNGPIAAVGDLVKMHDSLVALAEKVATQKLIPLIINPLAREINSRSH